MSIIFSTRMWNDVEINQNSIKSGELFLKLKRPIESNSFFN